MYFIRELQKGGQIYGKNKRDQFIVIIAWLCLILGWASSSGFILFPIGWILGKVALKKGADSSLIYKLNKYSFIIQVVIILMGVLIMFIWFLAAS